MRAVRIGLALPMILAGLAATGRAEEARPKVPVDLVARPDGLVVVALREDRSLIVVDAKAGKVVDRWPLDVRPAAVAGWGRDRLLVGGQDGEVLLIEGRGRMVRRWDLGRGPTRVLGVSARFAVAAPRWEEAVFVLDVATGGVAATHRVGFPVGALVRTPDGRAIAADAFGGRLVRIEPGETAADRTLAIDGLNLRGLAISGDGRELLVAHATQERPMPVTRTNIDWGLVISSKVTYLRLSEFDVPATSRPPNLRRLTLDGSGNGAADPTALAVAADGASVLVALGGAHQVLRIDRTRGARAAADLMAIGDASSLLAQEVGRSPAALALAAGGALAVTADSMSDTLTVVRTSDLRPLTMMEVGPRPVRSATERGEALFRDGLKAMDQWMTCATCHPDGHTVGRSFDTLGDGDYGAAKDTPSLLGVGPTAPFAWTGRFPHLADQVRQSLESSLQGPSPSADEVRDLVAYLESLPPPPPRRRADDPAAGRGASIFRARKCDACHTPPSFTSRPLRDPGLAGVSGRFSVPSLRGVGRSAPYFHDGRARTLEEALELHRPSGATLDVRERRDLAAYLESL